MPSSKTIRRHAVLVDRMATTLGRDLEEEVMRGRLSPDELPDMVLRCTACANPDGCEAWLRQQEDAATGPRPETTPYYCRTGDVFDALKPN